MVLNIVYLLLVQKIKINTIKFVIIIVVVVVVIIIILGFLLLFAFLLFQNMLHVYFLLTRNAVLLEAHRQQFLNLNFVFEVFKAKTFVTLNAHYDSVSTNFQVNKFHPLSREAEFFVAKIANYSTLLQLQKGIKDFPYNTNGNGTHNLGLTGSMILACTG